MCHLNWISWRRPTAAYFDLSQTFDGFVIDCLSVVETLTYFLLSWNSPPLQCMHLNTCLREILWKLNRKFCLQLRALTAAALHRIKFLFEIFPRQLSRSPISPLFMDWVKKNNDSELGEYTVFPGGSADDTWTLKQWQHWSTLQQFCSWS